MNGNIKLAALFLIPIFLSSCIYHERPQRDFGDLEILVDKQHKNIIHVIYKRDAIHFFNDLRNAGGLRDLHYTYYVVHHQLMEPGLAKTKVYTWFSEEDKYLFYPDEDSLLNVLRHSGPVLREFAPFNDVSVYRKYASSSFEHGRYYREVPESDTLYYWLGDSLEAEGSNSIKEINRKAFYGSRDLNNDTLYCYSMDHTFQASVKIKLPMGKRFYKFPVNTDSAFIVLKNKPGDSLFLHRFDLSQLYIGQLIGTKDLSAVPEEIRQSRTLLFVKKDTIELAWLHAVYNTRYTSFFIKDLYYYEKKLRHYEIREDAVFERIEHTK